jgi:erythromycin esterase-like protein
MVIDFLKNNKWLIILILSIVAILSVYITYRIYKKFFSTKEEKVSGQIICNNGMCMKPNQSNQSNQQSQQPQQNQPEQTEQYTEHNETVVDNDNNYNNTTEQVNSNESMEDLGGLSEDDIEKHMNQLLSSEANLEQRNQSILDVNTNNNETNSS